MEATRKEFYEILFESCQNIEDFLVTQGLHNHKVNISSSDHNAIMCTLNIVSYLRLCAGTIGDLLPLEKQLFKKEDIENDLMSLSIALDSKASNLGKS